MTIKLLFRIYRRIHPATWRDVEPLIAQYRQLIGDDPPDLINMFDMNALEADLLRALKSGKRLPEVPPDRLT